ncbi:PREDICTED: uncharacterized protein LOC109339802 [Lupinus angustifolius]|uniref:uncharacterized protein LOC109339802 n=1 Tax=Lupinus angustifolius TaxID=3871 RepID=UPI00092F94E4|nr:PREDICTED: uncharacterized protein LOC109339802 [Lupinus angustifolius]
MWLTHSDCRRLITETWRTDIIGCPMFILAQNLKVLKKDLRVWNRVVFGNIHTIIRNAMNSVDNIQNSITISGLEQHLLDLEDHAQAELLQALDLEEMFWKEKSRLNWHINGDINTHFFHRFTKIRQATNSMSMLKEGERCLSNQEDIANHVLNYYTDLFSSPNNTSPNDLIQQVIPTLVSEDENSMLTGIPSRHEIKMDVFAMNGEGAPGPDGFGGCFYQTFWDIVEEDDCNSIIQFFT